MGERARQRAAHVLVEVVGAAKQRAHDRLDVGREAGAAIRSARAEAVDGGRLLVEHRGVDAGAVPVLLALLVLVVVVVVVEQLVAVSVRVGAELCEDARLLVL